MSNPQVELHVTINVAETATQGVITLELDAVNAPKSTANFLAYVNSGFYNGTVFHRVIKNFMVQGGGMTADMKQKETQAPIENEAKNGLKNDKYTVAMARTGDPHSATAQFFINTVDNGFLNHSSPTPQGWGYAVFGKVVKGQDVVDAIKKVRTTRKGFHDDVPFDPVVIDKAVAALHAGWRGLAGAGGMQGQGIVHTGVAALCAATGSAPAELRAWLGPCIGPRRFEVGADVLRGFGRDPDQGAVDARFVPCAPGKWLADLPGLARDLLQTLGVQDISGGGDCTVSDPSRFFSFRYWSFRFLGQC